MSAERLIQVRAFSELRPGLLVVCKPCTFCGGAHRGILLNGSERMCVDAGHNFRRAFSYPLEPSPGPGKGHPLLPGGIVVGDVAVEQGIVWRVEIPPTAKTKARDQGRNVRA